MGAGGRRAGKKAQSAQLALPKTPHVVKQVSDGGTAITFLQVAVEICNRLVMGSEPGNLREELIFVRDCLNAGHVQTQLPCELIGDSDMHATGLRRTFTLNPADAGDAGTDTDEPAPATRAEKSSQKEEKADPPKRSGRHLRGGLRATIHAATTGDVKEFELSLNGGVPWMGPTVPAWPTDASDNASQNTKLKDYFRDHFGDWDFNTFEVQALADGRPLIFCGWESLIRSGCFSEFAINPVKTIDFLRHAESMYALADEKPYHNRTHAADVTQTVWAMIAQLGALCFFDPMDTVTCLFSAIIHDIGHDGRNNAFHVSTRDELAMTYNDNSVLENFHLSTAFRLLLVNESTNILADVPRAQLAVFRKEMIDMVLGTDMSLHFAKLSNFQEFKKKHGKSEADWQDDEAAMYSLRGMILHCADISNQAKPMWIAQQWTVCCLREFFEQGEEEKQLDLPVSPLCDKSTTDVRSSQIAFIKFIVQPTFSIYASVLPKAEVCVRECNMNKQAWEDRTVSDNEAQSLQAMVNPRNSSRTMDALVGHFEVQDVFIAI
eukprot:TRINITY_DN31752_c0_g1_i1.p1 TRINITY_DN31752_c0_g1~~TRINITY_DN31752_c0_g1_i1.p1  ORF type:complete len:549 (-),score=112.06 TRINITY_DN31752_c0_g1_i1:60-1706(-)